MLPPVVALPISETLGRPVANHLSLFSSQHWFLGSAGRRLAGVFHQQANRFIVFDDGSHVMVERHALGKCRELAAIGRPLSRVRRRAPRNRVPNGAMTAARGIGIDNMGRSHVLEQLQMRADCFHLRRLTGELSAQSGAGISRLFRLAEARLKGRIAAELWHIVIAPGDGIDADANFHG